MLLRTLCAESLGEIFAYHPLLGFVLRSTNVRNSFEIYRPILRLAASSCSAMTSIWCLSSEWSTRRNVYRSYGALPGFVLLGLPQRNQCNPLSTPSAGHELGDTTWQRELLSESNRYRRHHTKKAQLHKARYERLLCDADHLLATSNLSLGKSLRCTDRQKRRFATVSRRQKCYRRVPTWMRSHICFCLNEFKPFNSLSQS